MFRCELRPEEAQQRGLRRHASPVLPLLVADLPVDSATLARVLQAAGVARVRVTFFGTKACLVDTQALYQKWLDKRYMREEDTVEVDIGCLELPVPAGLEPQQEGPGHPQPSPRPEFICAVAPVDQNGFPFPYSYNQKAVIRDLLSIEAYPLFGSCLGTEYAQGAYTLNFRVRAGLFVHTA